MSSTRRHGRESGPPGGHGTDVPPEPSSTSPRRRRLRIAVVAFGTLVTVLLVAGLLAGWAVYGRLSENVTSDGATAAELARHAAERPRRLVPDALNVLLIGSDTRSGEGNGRYGRNPGGERSDTTILLHLAAGRRGAVAVSLPRDLMVRVPACRERDGGTGAARLAQFNSAFTTGGPACTIRTVERMTGVRIDHHVVVDFHGFKEMVDAVDGVDLCLAGPVRDEAAELDLPAGRVTLDGEQALGWVRARKSLGDGSDTARMERQQRFLGALVQKVRSDHVLHNPLKLYPVLHAATSALTTDPGLAGLRDLYGFVREVRGIPSEHIVFTTVPREAYPADPNRDRLLEPAADRLFELLRHDRPVPVTERAATGRTGARGAPAEPAPSPSFSGTTAAEEPCA
ncbi:LCP family protein [Streptomyces chilikensis]|uniref:LCP family protein n=1 Tax=Streptomyces chilikensis TaxID=1194079 RepID=UPI003F4D38ED